MGVNKLKSSFVVMLSLCFFAFSWGQDKIDWMTLPEALKLQQFENKKIVIDLYTDWCSWCKKMDQSTFSEEIIVKLINDNYLPVKFNAEQKGDIEFQGNMYKYVRYGHKGYHELAAELTRNRLSYPTIVFLDEDLNVIQALRGYQNSARFEQILAYFAQNLHKTTPWQQFTESYKPMVQMVKN